VKPSFLERDARCPGTSAFSLLNWFDFGIVSWSVYNTFTFCAPTGSWVFDQNTTVSREKKGEETHLFSNIWSSLSSTMDDPYTN
jgi:hypothetical protein